MKYCAWCLTACPVDVHGGLRQVANMIGGSKRKEKLEWAVLNKDRANELYAARDFKEACEASAACSSSFRLAVAV